MAAIEGFVERSPGVYVYEKGSSTRIITHSKEKAIPSYKVHTTSPQTKSRLLEQDLVDAPKRAASEQRIRETAVSIAPTCKDKFGLKQATIESLPFRLLRLECENDRELSSFIALSYCWLSSSWRRAPVCSEECNPQFPLSAHMGTALFAELHTAEGLYIDQLCVAQQDRNEKTIAVGAMDIVYRTARLAIVVIEDVQLSLEIANAFRHFDNDEEHMPSNDRFLLLQGFAAMSKCRWFTRAWCDHEFLVSRRCIILIGIDNGQDHTHTTLRLDASLLRFIARFLMDTLNSKNFETESIKADWFNIITDIDWDRMKGTFDKCNSVDFSALMERPHYPAQNSAFVSTAQRVLTSRSKYDSDKTTIILNSKATGLALINEPLLGLRENYRLALVAALACGDPTGLCTTGQHDNSPSWLREIRTGDIIRPQMEDYTITPRKLNVSISLNVLQLEVGVIRYLRDAYSPHTDSVKKAEWLIGNRKHYKPRDWIDNTNLDQLEGDRDVDSKMAEVYITALACALHLGYEWIAQT